MDQAEIDDIFEAYQMRFGAFGELENVDEEKVARVMLAAIEKREPIPDDYDWYADLAPDELA